MPRHIRNILIAALLAMLALTAGINGYVHHQFKTNIDQAFRLIQPIVQVKYSELSTSILSGKVELNNVRISAAFLPETITLGNVVIKTPGFAYMLSGPENIKNGNFPDHLGIEVKDFYFDLHSTTAEWLDRLTNKVQLVYASERQLCGGKSILGPEDYKKMGYNRLLSDLLIAYEFNEKNRTLHLKFNARTRNMGNINANIHFANMRSISSKHLLQRGLPEFTSADITYKDETYVPHIIKYCSELSGMKKEEFIDAEIKQSDEYFFMLWGFAPGQGLREAYKDFLLKPDLVAFTISPTESFNPALFSTMSNSEIIESLNPSLKINGLPIDDLSFKSPTAKFVQDLSKKIEQNIDYESLLLGGTLVKAAPTINKTKINNKPPRKYHLIELKDVEQHINNFIQVVTVTGNKRKGLLLRVDNGNLYIQRRYTGGSFTVTLPISKVETIEAYFSK